jgi:protein-tyrosine phosphatase
VSTPPLSVLHVCMGNICRSPMAERLLARAMADRFGPAGADLLYSHSAGTGGWHVGQSMDSSARRELTRRGGDPSRFAARRLRSEYVDASDLVLTATADHQDHAVSLRPDAAGRVFVLGQFGRLLKRVDPDRLPPAAATAEAVLARGVAIVEAADAARAGAPPEPADDLDDPYGGSGGLFTRIGAEIEDALVPFVALLHG